MTNGGAEEPQRPKPEGGTPEEATPQPPKDATPEPPKEEAAGEERPPLFTQKRLEGYRDKLVDGLLLALPIGAIRWITDQANDALFTQPWQALYVVAPLGVGTWLLLRTALRRGSLRLRGPFLLFLIGYLSIFAIAAGSDLLVLEQDTVTLTNEQAPRRWLLPARWGDWRYRLAPRLDPDQTPVVVVTMDEAPTSEARREARVDLGMLIRLAEQDSAAGVALDFTFRDHHSEVDAFLCLVTGRAAIDLISGQMVRLGQTGILVPLEYPDELDACFPERGHLLGFRDADGRIRHVPLELRGTSTEPALSARVAAALGSEVPPGGGALQYLEPEGGVPAIPRVDFMGLSEAERRALVDGRFVLVGEQSAAERFATPFGERLGVQIHAAAIASLHAGRWIHRTPWWASVLVILFGCYLVTQMAARGVPTRRIVEACLAITAFLVVASALAMRLWLVWLEVIYPLAAIWLLVPLMEALRRRVASPAPEEATG